VTKRKAFMLRHSLPISKPIHSNSDLLTEAEAAEFLGLEPKTLAVWRSTKRYPLCYVKVGRLVRYCRSDLLAFLESRRVPGT
jgi:predicted DNA-binding transcriptional regulator AlpA